uniref:NADH-ubiquinone oxidoreductase chain 2 n=1 Tax=Eurythenes maldoror TaxID=1836943 RepID=A0A343RBD0_9CRUS|nr:NADH dehydrogenase subunit 2 [Eurythenes maldoror]ATX68773.1 NADH dehydrogenase subunit 2 [Eurythenes maldoror]
MIFHPASPLFILLTTSSILLAVSSKSWFIAWMSLEINLLSFIPLMALKPNKYSSETTLKYFLIQAGASSIIILSVNLSFAPQITSPLILLALLLKAGAAPFHQWMPSLIEGLSWYPATILLTVQKLNPLILISYISNNPYSNKIMYLHILFSAAIGSVGGLTQTSLRKILVFSSITHLSWLLTSITISQPLWLLYFSIYSLILISLTMILAKQQSYTLNHILLKTPLPLSLLSALSLMSLGGLPPFTGFLPKLMVVQTISTQNHMFTLIALLSGTFISLFFYLRMFITHLFLTKTITGPPPFTLTATHIFALIINLTGLLIPVLSFILL